MSLRKLQFHEEYFTSSFSGQNLVLIFYPFVLETSLSGINAQINEHVGRNVLVNFFITNCISGVHSFAQYNNYCEFSQCVDQATNFRTAKTSFDSWQV